MPQKSYMGRWRVKTMNKEIMDLFGSKLTERLGNKFDLQWDVDKKGVVSGWCRLHEADDICVIAEIISDLKGRLMLISPLNTPEAFVENTPQSSPYKDGDAEKSIVVVINYHFFFDGINFTACITLRDKERVVKSITPILKSADWQEREMQEFFNIKLQGHPNPKKLFLDEGVHMTDHTMIPLSEAMDGSSTSTLWEKIMQSGRKEADRIE
jgi:NADH-quinone oxidoreductase subunit C